MSKSRVVFDTSVVVSAALMPQSVPRRAIDLAIHGGRVLFSEATITELEDVLRRPKFERYIAAERREEFLLTLVDQAEIVLVTAAIQQCRDPKDDKFLELGLAGSATHIVSGDADLLMMQSFLGIPIVTPAEFVASMRAQQP